MHLPPPSQRIRKQTAQRRTRGSPRAEYDIHVALPDPALPQGHDVSQQDRDDGVHAAAANAGHGPRDDQLVDILRQAAAQAAQAKDDIGEEKALLPAEDVGELAVQGLAARQGQEVSLSRRQLRSDLGVAKRPGVGTHAVAIQLVEFNALRSLPILAYCNSSGVSIILTGPKRMKKSEAKFNTIHQDGSKYQGITKPPSTIRSWP